MAIKIFKGIMDKFRKILGVSSEIIISKKFEKYLKSISFQFYNSLIKTGVHLVISSGLNNYQRTHVLGFNESNPTSPTPYLTSEAPTMFILAGGKNFGNTGSMCCKHYIRNKVTNS